MATATLVDEMVDEGQLLVDTLKSASVGVELAFWVLTSEDQLWFLYIATPLVDSDGLADAYRRVYGELANCSTRWISRSDIKLIGIQNPIAVAAKKYQGNLATWYHGRQLGKMIIEKAYIYSR